MRRFGAALVLAAALSSAFGNSAKASGSSAKASAERQANRSAKASAERPFDVVEKSISDLQAAMSSGAVSSRDLVAAYLARIQAYDVNGPRLHALIALNPHAIADADALDRERSARGPRGPLHGIPIVVKDNYETADMPTTGGSIALAGFETGRDAFQVRKLREAGAVIIGKTNLHELAAGITTISSLGGQTRNPYDPTRNPGGSSGGTGAAVAANFAAAGMGSDTCGSIRIPSSHNNLFGLRPTAGLSSRAGVIPLSHTQDMAGPLARSVTDLAIMLDATVGPDPADATTRTSEGHIPRSFRDALQAGGLKGTRVGILRNLFGSEPEDEEAAGVVRKALDELRKQGAETIDVTIPGLEELVRGSSVIDAEFKFDLMDYLAAFPKAPIRSLGDILERGDYDIALEATFKRRNSIEARETDAYRRARIRRDVVRDVVVATLTEQALDALAYPSMRRKAAVIGEPQRGGENCQVSPSTGLPAMSVPAGFTPDGLPIGMELLGRAWSEPALLRIAFNYEQAAHPRKPPLTTPALTDARAPVPATALVTLAGVRVSFGLDTASGRLTYDTTVSGPDAPIAAALHRGAEGQVGPVIVSVLASPARTSSGDVVLLPADREAFARSDLYLAVRTAAQPDRSLRAQVGARR